MEQRGRRQPEVMQQRPQVVAHPFGTRKRWWEAGYGLRRGLEKGRTECRVPVLASNLRRVWHRVAMPRVRAARGCAGRGPARLGAVGIVCQGGAWSDVDVMAARSLLALQHGTRFP